MREKSTMLWSLLFTTLIGGVTQAVPEFVLNMNQDCKVLPQSSSSLCTVASLSQMYSCWTADLLGLYEISRITINNTFDNINDLKCARILIGNSSMKNFNLTGPLIMSESKNGLKFGRYVTVYKEGSSPLHMVTIRGKKKELPFKLIKENKTWEEALYHCRQEYVDLVSILNDETQNLVELEAKNASTSFVWLGLHYTCTLGFWFWVSDHHVHFDDWATNDTAACDMSAAMSKDEEHQWHKKYANETFNFICAV